MATTRDIVAVLGGQKVFRGDVHDPKVLLGKIREGLPYASYEHVAQELQASLNEVGNALHIAARTRARRKLGQRLDRAQSDSLVRLARVIATASNTLGSPAKAAQWLRRPNRALGGEVPLNLLDTEVGEQLVEDVLGRLEYGVLG